MVMDGDSLRRIGDRVVKRREKIRWSQADLVRESGLSDLTVRRIEKGEAIEFRIKTWNQLCDALHWSRDSIDLIVTGEEPQIVDPSPPADELLMLKARVGLLEDDVRVLKQLVDEDARRLEPPAPPSSED